MPTDRFWSIGKPLYTSQIQQALRTHCREIFGVVLAKNQLRGLRPPRYPAIYVVNTDNEDQPGTHWTVFVCEEKSCYFFDSYGCPPEVYGKEFADFVRQQNVNHQPRWIQGLTSAVCGHYCLFYLCHRFHMPTNNALSLFTNRRQENDQYVHQWFHDHFPNVTFPDGQTCQSFKL